MSNILSVVQVDQAIKQLLHDALNLRDVEFDLLVCHTCQIVAQVVKEEEVTTSELVLWTR